ncbi:protein STICHEL-like 3 [Zea mays]|uniref:Protein STICHEL-like 3 n=1 Tax=Zea mays TaxID=4577 RepID=A0A1D6NDC0_MAIZE|nr:protein STICHEL-like 3 [Zea mays]ONM38485.1 Protein STICHEL-like 3 [Zea mays]|eukprot:XP_008675079.1 protein STICHEL-like 3 isoform X2 [Zea mays]
MPAPDRATAGGGAGGHFRGHAHLTNCIHLRHHHAHAHAGAGGASSSGRRRSPASASLMRDLLALQRSRSLRDPSTRRSVESSRVAADPDDGTDDDDDDDADLPAKSRRSAGALKTLLDQLAENPHPKPGRRPPRRFKRRAGRRAAAASKPPDRAAALSVNSSSQEAVCGNKYLFHGGGGGDDDGDGVVELQQHLPQDSRNVCGIPWNWSRLHHRGKSILDMAGRSLSCGLSDSKSAAGRKSEAPAASGVRPLFPVKSERLASSTSSDSDALPLLVEEAATSGARKRIGVISSGSYSGELGIFSNQTSEMDSDLLSESQSGHKSLASRSQHGRGRHRSLTQKFAPKTFKDVVGQSLVVQALSNAILRRKIGLVYVFYGPHGTGKTSCARVFAKALNCLSSEHPRPCDSCTSCIAHNLGKSRSLMEIGPVGNIDMEGIVDVLDNVMLSPAPSHYRVFIFDDCDTLPADTWSAISKVVDRAPRRVVFILVSPNLELPHIILSRCQKFFFPKLRESDIVNTLQWICTSESLDVDKDAMKLIASRSDGSLRDAEMTLDQLSLLGQRISLSLVQELVGLVSDDKLVDLLDLALSADMVNTVKTLRDITETGVEPLALMSQLATIITDILAGSYAFTRERPRRKFFKRPTLSKEDMEKLRQALKTLSEAEKQLRVSSDKTTWLTAALLQLAPDKQYLLPSSSTSTSLNHGVLVGPFPDRGVGRAPAVENKGNLAGTSYGEKRTVEHTENGHVLSTSSVRANEGTKLRKAENEMVWQAVLESIQSDTLRKMMAKEARLNSISLGTEPTVQLIISSHISKSKAENYRAQILQAFESVLRSAIILEIRYESKNDAKPGHTPSMFPYPENDSTLRRSFTKHSPLSSGEGEIIEVGPSRMHWHAQTNNDVLDVNERRKENTWEEETSSSPNQESVTNPKGRNGNRQNRQNSIVRGKVSLAHVIGRAEACSQRGGWSRRKAISIAEKLEQENLRMEPKSSLLCWRTSRTRRKLSSIKVRNRRSRTISRLILCGRCISTKSPR